MAKAAVVVLADVESQGDLGRAVNALATVKELQAAGHDVELVFDGAGTRWPAKLADASHPAHSLYESVSGAVAGVCKACANAFGAAESAQSAGVPLIAGPTGHLSIGQYIENGYEVLTF